MPNMEDLFSIKSYLPGYKQHWLYSEHGMPIMIIARYDSDGKKAYRQFHLEKDKWVEGMPLSPYPLFGLHTLKNFSPFNALLITEGEKCAHAIHQLSWPAIATALGSQNPSSSDWTPVRYYNRFIILRDNDKAGIAFAQKVSAEICRVCSKAELFVVNLSSEISGGDLIDWLQKTILRGSQWNGFDPIPSELIELTRKALYEEIQMCLIDVKDCPHVAFKIIEALFVTQPKAFHVELPSVSEFPLEVFPEKIKTYLNLVSLQFSQVPDYAATTFIATIAGIIGRSIHLRMRPQDVWYETANCWCMLIGPPSAKKSPIMRRIFSLFKSLDKQAAEEFAIANKSYKMKKKQAEKCKEDFEEPLPIRKRYVTDDVTIPKLRELMGGNPKGIILRNDELKGQLERLDKIGSEGDRSFMMSCWSGLEDYSEDRMCRTSLLNISLALTWIGCIPPAPLQRYLREAMGKGNGADGFMPRFQFVCFPDHKKQFTLSEDILLPTLDLEIQQWIQRLDEESKHFNRKLYFNTEAQLIFDEWLIKHENNTRFGGHPLYWESYLGKQAKALAVLVILIHRLHEVVSGELNEAISLVTLRSGFKGLKYYQTHAIRCYASVSGGSVNDAEIILNLIKQKRLLNRFKAQDIYHQGLGGLSDSLKVRAALELLQDYGWIISEKVGGNIGRQHEYWIIHPKAFEY